MLTWTTYGTWLRGDARGWVSDGIVFPRNPVLEAMDRGQLRYPPFVLPREQRWVAGTLVGEAIGALGGRIHALCVASWHVHVVVGYMQVPVGEIVKAAKDAVRWGLRYQRAIWAGGYDKRFCFDEASLANRIDYVRRHNLEDNLPPDPWSFITPPTFLNR